jgi:hypothetical protein
MARNRMIKPEFWSSEQVVECSTTARLLFIGLWNFSDDAGNHPASLRRMKLEIFPGDEFTLDQIGKWLAELISVGLVEVFTHITGWHHQRIEKPSYKYPPPLNGDLNSTTVRRPFDDRSEPKERKGKEKKGKEKNSSTSTSTSSFWDLVEKRAAAVAQRLREAKRWRRTRDMKSLVLNACALFEHGACDQTWLDQAVEAVVAAEKVESPTGFLARELTESARSEGQSFASMRRGVAIPEELLNPKPKGGE